MNDFLPPKTDWKTVLQHHLTTTKSVLFIALIILIGLIVGAIDLYPKLSHMSLTMLSGPKSGQSYALVEKLSKGASTRDGRLTNISTKSVEDNLLRLTQPAFWKKTQFAVVPDGLKFSQPKKLELIARLPKLDTVFFLGVDAANINHLVDLKGMRIGIGPIGSGNALLARQLLGQKDLAGLNLELSEYTFTQQLEKLLNGELDFGVFLVSDDNPLIKKALLKGLKIASFENAKAWVTRFPALHEETLYAGHFDQVALIPQKDKKIFRVDTLVLSDRTASRSDVVSLLVLLNESFHGFLDYNRNTLNNTGLTISKDLHTFINNGGPNFLDEYVPGLVDFMPPANWLHFVVVISLLMNMLTGWNKLRLYLIDSNRVKIENQVQNLFGAKLTFEEFNKIKLLDRSILTEADRKLLEKLIIQSEQLLQRCKKYAVSFVTPMGQENIYRYHEGLIKEQLEILKNARAK